MFPYTIQNMSIPRYVSLVSMIALVLYKHIHCIVFTVCWRDVKESRVRIPDDCCCISISYEYDWIFPSVYDGDI